MPVFIFKAEQVVQGANYKVLMAARDLPTAQADFARSGLATPGLHYKPFVYVDRPENPTQILGIEVAGPAMSPAHVRPQGQPNQQMPLPPRDPRSCFQDIDHAEMAAFDDKIYGETGDGTFTDLVQSGGDVQEYPRKPQ